MASEIDTLLQEAQELSAELISLNSKFQELENKNSNQLASLAEDFKNLNSQINAINSIHDLRGRRSPKWYVVEIPFEFGETKAQSRTVEVEMNPFICTQLQCSYLITDEDPEHFPYILGTSFATTNPAGRSIPCSSYKPLCTLMQAQWSVDIAPLGIYTTLGEVFSSDGPPPTTSISRGFGWNYPEFDFEISIVGSGRHWSHGKVPAPAFFGGSTPLYLGHQGFIDGTDRIEVVAHPTIPTINTQGIVKLVFFGYEIETTENLSDILGY